VTRYFESQKFSQLAATSQQDRRSHLGPNGVVSGALGSKRVDEITADTLVDWWEANARERDWSVQTGFRYISAIAEVLKLGRRYLSGSLPTIEARERIGEQRKTAAGRAGSGPQCRPIEDPAAIQGLVDTVQESEGLQVAAFVLALLDAGLRRGEALALRWRHIAWGADENDPRRHLAIGASRSRDSIKDGTTKSGHTRRVGLSRRLHGALGNLYLDRPPSDLNDLIFPEINADSLRPTWQRIIGRADLPGVRVKDLRDTFASQLLTVGIPIQWVSRQLGHSGVSVTERHYAKYLGVGGDEFVYVEPLRLEPGEVPADLLSRLQDCSQSAHKGDPFTVPEVLQSAHKSAGLQ
jgi:integrase